MLRIFFKTNLVNVLRNVSSMVDGSIVPATSSVDITENKQNALTELEHSKQKVPRTDLSEISKVLRPGAVSSMYVNKSDTLQQLVKLGVKLYEIEKDPEAMKFILGLKFEDIRDTVIYLKELGLETEQIGYIITKNPLVLQENLEDLKVRVNYLQYKKFTADMITRIVENNPFWLTYSTEDIDNKLGFFQYHFSLTGNEVRLLTTKCPRLITYPIKSVKLNTFVVKEEMGFSPEEIKKILLDRPQIFKTSQHKLLKTFEYLHKEMKIPLETIADVPQILNCRVKRLKERHQFLVKLGSDQYDCKKPNYVSLLALISNSDTHFSTEVAKSSVQLYNEFLKTL